MDFGELPRTEFCPQPLLQEVGWKNRLPLDDLVYHDRWGVWYPL